MATVIDPRTLKAAYLRLIGRRNVSEESVHRFLVRNPNFLPLWFPFDNLVFTKLPLGSQYVLDFAFAREDSHGVNWHLFEIERPQFPFLTRSGNPSSHLVHALRQANNWKSWFDRNRDYVINNFPFAARMRQHGVLSPTVTVIIGRRKSFQDEQRMLLSSFPQMGVRIMSFDRLADSCESPACTPNAPLRMCRFAAGMATTVAEIEYRVKFIRP